MKINNQDLDLLRKQKYPLKNKYCNDCEKEQPTLMPKHVGLFFWFILRRKEMKRGRICMVCGYQYDPKLIKNKEIRNTVYQTDHHQCVYCGSTNNLSIDHVIPQSRGGDSSLDNLVTACHQCNALKQDNRTMLVARFGRFSG